MARIIRTFEQKVAFTLHTNGDVTTEYDGCGHRLYYHHAGGYLEKENEDGSIVYAYGKTHRTRFIMDMCDL